MPTWGERQRERVLQGLAAGQVVHVTHGMCLDGMSCVGLVRRAFPGAVWVGVQPDEVAEALEWLDDGLARMEGGGRARILVTDLSPPGTEATTAALQRIAQVADLVWLDHHEPQWPRDLEERVATRTAWCAIDRTGKECAATMTLAFLESLVQQPVGGFRLERSPFNHKDRQAMAAVAHRDAWTDPDDLAGIRLGLVSQRLGADYAVLVEHGEWRALDLLAEGPFRRRRRELKEAMGRMRVEGPVATVFGPAPLSDLAHATWPVHPGVRLVLHFTRDGRVRIRSHPDLPVAAQLANRFGGGGHAHAAGARLVSGSWLRMAIYRTFGPRHVAVQRFLQDAYALAGGPGGPPEAEAATEPPRAAGRRGGRRLEHGEGGEAVDDAGGRPESLQGVERGEPERGER